MAKASRGIRGVKSGLSQFSRDVYESGATYTTFQNNKKISIEVEHGEFEQGKGSMISLYVNDKPTGTNMFVQNQGVSISGGTTKYRMQDIERRIENNLQYYLEVAGKIKE